MAETFGQKTFREAVGFAEVRFNMSGVKQRVVGVKIPAKYLRPGMPAETWAYILEYRNGFKPGSAERT